MQIRKIPISKINPSKYNPRKDLKPDDSEYLKLLKSIDEFGYVDPLIWNKRTGNLVGGHQRFKILLAKGLKDIEVSVVDLSHEKEKALNLALNKISGDWDRDKLSNLLDELCQLPDFDVSVTGFDLSEIENIIAESLSGIESEENFDLDAELGKDLPVITKMGDIINLGLHGEHRLICGDVTNSKDVHALLNKFRAQLCHTDPPYGVSYDRRNRPTSKNAKTDINPNQARSMKLQNDDLSPQKYKQWFSKVTDAIDQSIVPGAAFYIWNSHKNFGLMSDLLTERNFKISSVITWAKESFCPNFSDYNEQTEFCLYGWKTGATHKWYGPKNESTLWRINRDNTNLYNHPTQKALELARRAIRNSSESGDIVFDPFLGSGTTLTAAAPLGRRCFGMEIEPKYCDIIVRRYIATAGKDSVQKEVAKRYCTEKVAV